MPVPSSFLGGAENAAKSVLLELCRARAVVLNRFIGPGRSLLPHQKRPVRLLAARQCVTSTVDVQSLIFVSLTAGKNILTVVPSFIRLPIEIVPLCSSIMRRQIV